MHTPIEFEVIDGIKKEKPDYFTLYSTAFINALKVANEKYETISEYDSDTLKKLIWSGVKMIIASKSRSSDKDSLIRKLSLVTFINGLMELVTPKEFQNIFPIDKVYLDENDGWKDYFYTRRYIEKFGEDRAIGKELDEFLWEYQNPTINKYMACKLSIASSLRKLETGKGIMEEFLEEQGVPTYTMHKDANGKKYLENNETGEISEVKKPKPRYLRVVK